MEGGVMRRLEKLLDLKLALASRTGNRQAITARAIQEDDMSAPRIEHVNIRVADPQRTAALLRALFDWHVRWSGPSGSGGFTIHVGSDDHYVAVNTPAESERVAETFTKGKPLNHIGVVVDDLDATEARVVAAGLRTFNHADYEPGRRFYFLDPDGIEYEVVSYAKPT
jgi:catechol 2,3-dioxygenase-like lactoylglutathione lyase family enzyme